MQEYVAEALVHQNRLEAMIKNKCWNTAIDQKLKAEQLKAQAGVELLLWILAVLQMPDEPNPWKELQDKEKKAREEANDKR